MDKVSNYSVYQSNLYQSTVQKKKNEDKTEDSKVKKSDKTDPLSEPKLSRQAKALLEELKKKYVNMDLFVADYETDEEAQAYLSRGTKQYSVLFDTETLEQMAADEDIKAKYIGMIDEATGKMDEIKESLGEDAENVKNIGMVFKEDGTISYFAELEKSTAKQKENVEKSQEEKKAQKKEEEKKAEKKAAEGKIKKTTVQADTMEELIEKIKEINWDNILPENVQKTGGKFDYSV
ncbi:MAG: hypothetical protein K2M46_00435 [Lachnospiraceae bacterium]|nr:hypothetical protein [Lachnospiraceae bacterium]